MLRKQATKRGAQWDQYLSGVLCACHNTCTVATPHNFTGEKPSFLLFAFNCCFLTELALVPAKSLRASNVSDYWE